MSVVSFRLVVVGALETAMGLGSFVGALLRQGGSRDRCGPPPKNVTEVTNSLELRLTHFSGCIFERTRDRLYTMEDAILRCEGWLG